jgi:tyrosyl-tRNA synthetase
LAGSGIEKEVKKQLSVIKKHAVDVLPEEELVKKLERSLKENKPLRVKLGVDPTAPDLHLGHAVVLKKLRDFQDLGHEVILLIGDYTGLIGDPSGRKTTRPVLTEDEIKKNAETYVEQAFKILDPEKTKIDYNSRWLKPLSFADVIKLCGKFTVARLLERDDFTLRMQSEQPIFLHELLYPVMQAYDSVMLEADVELGGTDQKFNLLAGRDLQIAMGQEPQIIVTMPLLEGLDGTRKMSKSYGNYIAFNDSPNEMFGKVMSIPDELIGRYYRLVLFYDEDNAKEIEEGIISGKLHPAEVKRNLAEEIVAFYYGAEEAKKAREEFDRVFKEKELPSEIPEFIVHPELYKENGKVWIVRLLKDAGLVPSNSEARRLIEQGGVKLNGETITKTDFEFAPRSGDVIKVGKRKFLKLQVKGN